MKLLLAGAILACMVSYEVSQLHALLTNFDEPFLLPKAVSAMSEEGTASAAATTCKKDCRINCQDIALPYDDIFKCEVKTCGCKWVSLSP